MQAIGYVWQYTISNITHASETKEMYFKARECYRCSERGFQHTERKEIIKHIKQIHKPCNKENEVKAQKGIVGISEEAEKLYETLFHITPFEPKHIISMYGSTQNNRVLASPNGAPTILFL